MHIRTLSEFLTEGGQFGHLSNVWEINNLTVSQLVDIISDSIHLKFDYAELKLDSVALSFTVKGNGKVVAARNKGQSKNFGANGLDAKGIAAQFKGRGIEKAFFWAISNIQSAVDKLSDKQKTKIFNNGRNWMAMEVIGHGASNILHYVGVQELTLIGTIEHDVDGNKIGPLHKENARMLDGMLRQKKLEQQSKFVIKNVLKATFNEIKNSDHKKAQLISQLKSIMGSSKSIHDYKETKVRAWLSKHFSDPALISQLLKRWIEFDKSVNIRQLATEYPDQIEAIKTLEGEFNQIIKEIMLPIEKVFLRLGAEVMAALNVFKSKDPSVTAAKIRSTFTQAVDKIKANNEVSMVKKLSMELSRLEAAGGADAISPEEGITFFIDNKGERTLVKLTGAFAPVNQIIGLLYNIVER